MGTVEDVGLDSPSTSPEVGQSPWDIYTVTTDLLGLSSMGGYSYPMEFGLKSA